VDVWGYTGNALAVMTAVKSQFDPYDCLSPGRFVGPGGGGL
jgi:glycolate oxidase FAD binding subunit